MGPVQVEVLIGVLTLILSVSASMFVAGSRWGRIEGDMRNMSDRLARIEGMFTLQLKDADDANRTRRH